MTREPYFAHSKRGEPYTTWELLEHHLADVSVLAETFAGAFGSGAWGRIAGLWHDLGKYREAFQHRIRGENIQAPHASAGAALASRARALPLAFAIAGHHAGLSNRVDSGESGPRPLSERLREGEDVLREIQSSVPAELWNATVPSIPEFLKGPDPRKQDVELWTRFLFSALVDADFLATEAFYDPTRRESVAAVDSIATLMARLDARLDALQGSGDVNRARAEVLAACREAAPKYPGVFSLTVPTGGGKTLSAMSFALRHAHRHGLRRVIVVIPYTSIIEQTAAVYRDYLGSHNVVEHHSAIDEEHAREVDGETELRRRLAAENWDAPIVVTTAVQFFESLFSNRPSRCRKLHNIARSVVLIDEAQTLPAGYLLCVLDVLKRLVGHYGSSIVLSTATQPAIARRAALPQGLEAVREIVPDVDALSVRLQRVSVVWPTPDVVTPYEQLAQDIAVHTCVLAIVHRRDDARRLASLLPKDGCFHLSALMCAAHRLEVLRTVKDILRHGGHCRLVTTQLVEAGVDIDFPVVYRANAGLDSLAQAAGRCNREGRLQDNRGLPIPGQFIVFNAETKPPRGMLSRGLEIALAMQREYAGALDLMNPGQMTEYFRRLLHTDLDKRQVMPQREQLNFAMVDRLVELVEEDSRVQVVVPWRDARERLVRHQKHPSRMTQRALQPYIVQVSRWVIEGMVTAGVIEPVEPDGRLYAVSDMAVGIYDEQFGLTVGDLSLTPEAYIV